MGANLNHAASFLTAIDEDSDQWTFQTFDDSPGKDKSLTRVLHGSLERHADELDTLNERGAGIFFTVNQTDLKGRKKGNITRIRALFIDLDGSPLEPALNAPTPPHIIVATSPGKFHAYWRIRDCALDQCEPALGQLIERFRADPACSDRSRVMRLPGFLHRKVDPHPVHVIFSSPGECSLSDLGIDLQKSQKNQESSSVSSVPSVGEVIARYLPDNIGQRNRCLFELARHLKGLVPNASKQELREIVAEWHRLALPNIGTSGFTESWGDFHRSWNAVHTPYGSVMNRILAEIEITDRPPSSLVSLGYDDKAVALCRICKQLQANAGEGPFFISARQAGELIGLHFTDASKVLYALVADGVLSLVKRGAGKVASRYRYTWYE